jgi:hypothetical protein
MGENLTTIEKIATCDAGFWRGRRKKNYNPTPATTTMGSTCQQALELLLRYKLAFDVHQNEELSGECKWCNARAHSKWLYIYVIPLEHGNPAHILHTCHVHNPAPMAPALKAQTY